MCSIIWFLFIWVTVAVLCSPTSLPISSECWTQQVIFLHTSPLTAFFFCFRSVLFKPWRWLWCGENPSRSALCEVLWPASSDTNNHLYCVQSLFFPILMLTLNFRKLSPSPCLHTNFGWVIPLKLVVFRAACPCLPKGKLHSVIASRCGESQQKSASAASLLSFKK